MTTDREDGPGLKKLPGLASLRPRIASLLRTVPVPESCLSPNRHSRIVIVDDRGAIQERVAEVVEPPPSPSGVLALMVLLKILSALLTLRMPPPVLEELQEICFQQCALDLLAMMPPPSVRLRLPRIAHPVMLTVPRFQMPPPRSATPFSITQRVSTSSPALNTPPPSIPPTLRIVMSRTVALRPQ